MLKLFQVLLLILHTVEASCNVMLHALIVVRGEECQNDGSAGERQDDQKYRACCVLEGQSKWGLNGGFDRRCQAGYTVIGTCAFQRASESCQGAFW